MKIQIRVAEGRDAQNIPGLRVELWADGREAEKLATAQAGADGYFLEVDQKQLLDRGDPQLSLRIYERQELRRPAAGSLTRRASELPSEWQVELAPRGPHQEGGTEASTGGTGGAEAVRMQSSGFVFSGRVFHSDGAAVAGLTVQIVELGLGGQERSLGQARTGEDGSFRISHAPSVGASIVARVFNKNGDRLAGSRVYYRSARQIQTNLYVTDQRYRSASEWQRTNQILEPFLTGLDAGNLTSQDVALLVGKTGMSRRRVTRYVTALRQAAFTGVDPELLFGLSAEGGPLSGARLVALDSDRMDSLLRRAVHENLVGLDKRSSIDGLAEGLRDKQVEAALQAETEGSLGSLFSAADIDGSVQEELVVDWLDRTESVREFWADRRQAYGDRTVDAIQQTLQAGLVTGNHTRLVRTLRQKKGIRQARELARYTRQDWLEFLDEEIDGIRVGLPWNFEDRDEEELRRHYVDEVMRRVEWAFPTAVVAEAMRAAPAAGSEGLADFLDANPDFRFETTDVKTFVASKETVIPKGLKTDDLIEKLQAHQRIFRLAGSEGRYDTMRPLLEAGLDSALKIRQKGARSFKKEFGPLLGERVAAQTYGYASMQSDKSLMVTAAHAGSFQGPDLAVVTSTHQRDQDTGVADEFPDWRSLFGSLDFCQCEHCRSVLSPAAYFVDLLHWLDVEGVLNKLLQRRPDLENIELSCENTNTTLPYADLVREVLEDRVADAWLDPDGVVTLSKIEHSATSYDSDVLLARPEYVNHDVYTHALGGGVFPFELPLDLWGLQARTYLADLGVQRWELMEAFRRGGSPNRLEVAAEHLGLSTAERLLTVGRRSPSEDSYDNWTLWGYRNQRVKDPDDSATTVFWYELVARVPIFLDKTGLEFSDLLDLLHADLANPEGEFGISPSSDDSCDTEAMTLVNVDGEPPQGPELGRMRRFLRLLRVLPWSIIELDKVLIGLGVDGVGDQAIRDVSHILRIQDLVDVDLLPLMTFWSNIDVKEDREGRDEEILSLYDRTFMNQAIITDEEDWPFALEEDRSEIHTDHLGTKLFEVEAELQAALSVSAEDLSAAMEQLAEELELLTDESESEAAELLTLDLEVLSALYRRVTLAKVLEMDVEEALAVRALLSDDPFASARQALDFIEEAQEIQTTGFSTADLYYLLGHDEEAALESAPADDDLALTLMEIRDGVQAIRDEATVESDPAGDLTRAALLQYLGDEEAVDAIMSVLDGSYQPEEDEPSGLEVVESYLEEVFDAVGTPSLLENGSGLETAGAEQIYTALLTTLTDFQVRISSEALVEQTLVNALGLELSQLQNLLTLAPDSVMSLAHEGSSSLIDVFLETDFIEPDEEEWEEDASGLDPDLNDDDQPTAFAALTLLHKSAAVLTTLELDYEEQNWLFENGQPLALLSPLDLPLEPTDPAHLYPKWRRLATYAQLRDDLPGSEPVLHELLDYLIVDEGGSDDEAVADFIDSLSDRTDWNVDDIEHVAGAFGWSSPADFLNVDTLDTLAECFAFVEKTGMSAANVDSWRAADLSEAEAEAIALAAKSKYGEDDWPEAARPLRDVLRKRQREALVGWLIQHDDELDDENDLFADVLMDVEMDPCFLTSRLKQAVSSVQLFVHRALMSLEPDVELSEDARERWEWMKNYRVWEANRKVFLWPENWLETELRTEKSPLFVKLESELLQRPLTTDTAEDAYLNYMQGLLDVNRLDVRALYIQKEDEDTDDPIDVVHVFARTQALPHRYYYRRFEDGERWTPWESVDLDIEGDHLTAAVHNRRLMLFWPLISDQSAREGSLEDPSSPREFLEVQMAFSEYRDGGWTPKRLSEDVLDTDDQQIWSKDREDFLFRPTWTDGVLSIRCYFSDAANFYRTESYQLGSFVFDDCTGQLNAEVDFQDAHFVFPQATFHDPVGLRTPEGDIWWTTEDEYGKVWFSSGEVDQQGNLIDDDEATDNLVLRGRTGRGYMAVARQYDEFASQAPFFFRDDERVFYVVPQETWGVSTFAPMFEEDSLPLDGDDVPIDPPYDPGPPKYTPPIDVDLYFPFEERELLTAETIGDDLGDLDDWRFAGAPARSTKPRKALTRTSTSSVRPFAALESGSNPSAWDLMDASYQTSAQIASVQEHNFFELQDTEQQLGFATDAEMGTYLTESRSSYRFYTHYHPYVCRFVKEIRKHGIDGLLAPEDDGQSDDTLARQLLSDPDAFENAHDPVEDLVTTPYPIENVDFDTGGAYSDYNWELFFHIPLLIAERLRREGRFDEAMQWFHYIFDPTCRTAIEDQATGEIRYETPQRWWKIQPFQEESDEPIEDLLALLPVDLSTVTDPAELDRIAEIQAELEAQIAEYQEEPFDPWAIARLRPTAYQKAVVIKYVQNLIDWGDQLFRQFTMETLNEAVQLYVLAAEILGDEPEEIPPREEVSVYTFADVRNDLDAFSNALVQVENLLFAPNSWTSGADSASSGEAVYGSALYFCVPHNENLLDLWETVADRLYKIRHCMDIEGKVRQPPLFQPPISPELLVRAAAAGVDLGSVLSGFGAPLPHYRFTIMIQRAQQLCGTVKNLGAALLSALEKRDSEELARLRASHETAVLKAVLEVRERSVEEAEQNVAALEKSQALTQARLGHYERLLDEGLSAKEEEQIEKLKSANTWRQIGQKAGVLASTVAALPDIDIGTSGVSSPVIKARWGGLNLSNAVRAVQDATTLLGSIDSHAANLASINAGYDRREEDWELQATLADKELEQIEKQILAAQIRLEMAEKDLANQELQIDNAKSVESFMKSKYTDQELYEWMVSQVATLYNQAYQLAVETAQAAERCYQHELGRSDSSFVTYGHWDALKKGLLAGERLQSDLDRMESDYYGANRRELELTKHVSLASLDPLALVRLRLEGSASFSLDEAVFDMDAAGLYFRRIKSVALTIPAVTGPYAGVHCMLTLVSSSARVSAEATGSPDDYPRDLDNEDDRFRDDTGAVESVITSSALNDSGLFEPNLQDPRYLPFERRGAVSSWNLQLPGAMSTFDRNSISDVVLHLRYTARDGGEMLRADATGSIKTRLNERAFDSGTTGLARLFSARSDFPDSWHQFLNPTDNVADQELELDLSEERFPYAVQEPGVSFTTFDVFLIFEEPPGAGSLDMGLSGESIASATQPLNAGADWGGNAKGSFDVTGAAPQTVTLTLSSAEASGLPSKYVEEVDGTTRLAADAVRDLILVVNYQVNTN